MGKTESYRYATSGRLAFAVFSCVLACSGRFVDAAQPGEPNERIAAESASPIAEFRDSIVISKTMVQYLTALGPNANRLRQIIKEAHLDSANATSGQSSTEALLSLLEQNILDVSERSLIQNFLEAARANTQLQAKLRSLTGKLSVNMLTSAMSFEEIVPWRLRICSVVGCTNNSAQTDYTGPFYAFVPSRRRRAPSGFASPSHDPSGYHYSEVQNPFRAFAQFATMPSTQELPSVLNLYQDMVARMQNIKNAVNDTDLINRGRVDGLWLPLNIFAGPDDN